MKCPVCKNEKIYPVFRFDKAPIYGQRYYQTRKKALQAETSPVDFVQCEVCTFLFNYSYQQLSYQVYIETSRSASPRFNQYLNEVSNTLCQQMSEEVSVIVEIGAGDCEFAKVFQQLIPNSNYYAYDPGWSSINVQNGITKYPTYYDYGVNKDPDLVIARHVLEHQSDVCSFMSNILHEEPKYCFIEIPCSDFVLNNNYHYFSYDHCSYFNLQSLRLLLEKFQYELLFSDNVFNNEYLITLWKNSSVDQNFNHSELQAFRTSSNRKIFSFSDWSTNIMEKFNEDCIIWGAGGKGVILLNMLEIDYNTMPFIAELNPKIWGKYIPCTANEIISPKQLKTLKPKQILVLNPLYREEICNQADALGLNCEVISIFN
jgi:hypothetical protein|tara:strand:- start:700 stop:1818 length:1119 start_codon:yes stop_codon:yes gene_type:complete